MKTTTKFLARSAAIAAVYASLTLILSPISFGSMQLRASEALSVLAYFSPTAVVGLAIGCAVANMWSPYGLVDIIFGSLATLLAAYITYKLPKRGVWKYIAPLPSVIINSAVISAVITFSAANSQVSMQIFLANALSIALPQALVCYGLGLPLMLWLDSSGIARRIFN